MNREKKSSSTFLNGFDFYRAVYKIYPVYLTIMPSKIHMDRSNLNNDLMINFSYTLYID